MTDTDWTPTVTRVVVDDHSLFREGVASLLARADDIALVGEAATGEDAVPLVEDVLPDIVLMDVKMPGMGGIEATRRIVAQAPHIGVLMLTMFEDDESVFAALKAGARGDVLKDADCGTLLRAIRSVARGEALLVPSIAQRVLAQFTHMAPPPSITATAPPSPAAPSIAPIFSELTSRELEVLRLYRARAA
jgi:DNA-binding NarL/FixJ family response regulator